MSRITCLLAILWLQGCAGIFLASTISGAYLLSSFSSFSETKNEYLTKREVEKDLKDIKSQNPNLEFNFDIIVFRSTIFAIGTAKNKQSMEYPLNHIAEKYTKYKLIDEIKLKYSINTLSDAFVSFKVKSKLLLANDVRYSNYYISALGGEVTIIGYASNNEEYSIVLDKITKTRGVKSVLNYVEVKDLEE